MESQRGRAAAVRWYAGQVAGAVVPGVRRRLSSGPAADGEVGVGGGARAGFDVLIADVSHAVRSLVRRPTHTAGAILTIALAIGANSATFGMIDAILLRPLSYPDGDRIVSLAETHPERQSEWGWVSIPNLADWRAQSTSFESVALFRAGSMAVTGGGEPAYVIGMRVEPAFFDVFGTPALVGRTPSSSGAIDGTTVVLSHGLWMRRYGGSAEAIGQTLLLDGSPRMIVGVMPPGYDAGGDYIGRPVDLWVPFDFVAMGSERDDRSYNAAARLVQGMPLADAASELSLLEARLETEYPRANESWTTGLQSWKELVVGDTRGTLLLVWAAMLLVLLAACANVGNLVLDRALAMESEAAVRRALGARSGRLIRGVLSESVLIALSGAAIGLAFAVLLLNAARALDPGDLPRLATASIDLRVAAVTGIAGVLVGLLIGLYPAWHAARVPVQEALRSSRSGATPGARRARDAMAVVQLAVAVALLAGSALALRGFLRLRDVSPGFEPEGVLTATVVLSWNRVPELAARAEFTRSVIDRLRDLPGVESAAMINSLPFTGSSMQQTFAIAGRPAPSGDEPFAGIRAISPGYAATMRIPVLGREFEQADLTGEPVVAMINTTLARRYFGEADPVGERLVLFGGDVEAVIVGVIGDVHHFALDQPAVSEIHVPYTADVLSSKTFLVRAWGDPSLLADRVRGAIHDVDPDQPLRSGGPDRTETVLLERMVDASLAGRRFRTMVLALLAGLAVFLSAVGLSSVIAITVTERSREIGLRIALGASRQGVLRWILSKTVRLALLGLLAGMMLVLIGGRALEALLFDITARDFATLALAALAFCVVAAQAVLGPALRATRLDPATVLREE
jgi:predicted permease